MDFIKDKGEVKLVLDDGEVRKVKDLVEYEKDLDGALDQEMRMMAQTTDKDLIKNCQDRVDEIRAALTKLRKVK